MTIITIDGTFASGKGTLGKRLATHYGYAYLDTGKFYRAVAAKVLADGIDLSDAQTVSKIACGLKPADLENPKLKSGKISAAASKISIHQPVRDALFPYQREFAENPGKGFTGAVLDGRDIGTVICPDADVKLYVDAKPEERARRRHAELVGYGENVALCTVLAQLKERDQRDMNRANAPLKPAENAHLLDTTNLSIDAVFKAAQTLVDAALGLSA